MMNSKKTILLIVSLMGIISGKEYFVNIADLVQPQLDDDKFLPRAPIHLTFMSSFSDYLLKLFNVKKAELMSKAAPN